MRFNLVLSELNNQKTSLEVQFLSVVTIDKNNVQENCNVERVQACSREFPKESYG